MIGAVGGRAPNGGVHGAVGRSRAAMADARADDVFLYAAALTFYGLLSVAPLAVVALWATSLLVGEDQVQHVADELAALAPPALGAGRAFERVASAGSTLGLAALAASLWPATAYGAALVRVLDRVAGAPAATGVRRRGAALLLVGLMPVLVLGILIASYAGAAVLGDSPVEIVIGLVLALLCAFAATVATVAAIYRIFPRTRPSWHGTFRGALVAAGCISIVSVVYVAYLRVGAVFEHDYASDALATVVLLGLWLFAANASLLVGYRATGPQVRRPDSGA